MSHQYMHAPTVNRLFFNNRRTHVGQECFCSPWSYHVAQSVAVMVHWYVSLVSVVLEHTVLDLVGKMGVSSEIDTTVSGAFGSVPPEFGATTLAVPGQPQQ